MTLNKKPVFFDVTLYTPISSSKRSHRIIQLSNNLLALLISDPSETIASCAISVATGSHNDPPELPGLAHFCEHMVLSSGSKKYPEPNFFHESLTRNNGSKNAHTTGEQTSFYFEVPHTTSAELHVFEQLIDILAASFKEPVFHDILVNKEIYAIHSEHMGNKSTLSKMLYHATRLLANENHPFSHFSTGNVFTLTNMPRVNKLNLKTELIKYFKEHFRAEKMVVCIRGSQSLNQLSKLAQLKFGDIPGSAAAGSPTSSPLKLKSWRSSNSITSSVDTSSTLASLDESRILKDTWLPRYSKEPVFTPRPKYNSMMIQSKKPPVIRFIFPVNYLSTRFTDKEIATYTKAWCDIIGDEGYGSFCHFLRQNNYISDLLAFSSSFAVNDDGLILQLHLTNYGWANVSIIVPLFWKYTVNTILDTSLSKIGQYLSELNSIDLLKFLYQDVERSPMERCAELCDQLMQDLSVVPPPFILKTSGLMFDCNDPRIQKIGSYSESQNSTDWWRGQAIKFQTFVKEFTTIENVKMIMLGPLSKCPFYSNSMQLTADTHYEYDYLKAYIEITELEAIDNEYEFHIPSPNQFLVPVGHKLSYIKKALLAASAQSENSSLFIVTQSDLLQTTPSLAGKNAFYELWTKEEDINLSFKSKSIVSLEVISTTLKPAPEYTMQLEILGQLLFSIISPVLYPAERAGYTYELSLSSKGDVRLGITLSGFTEGIMGILNIILDSLLELGEDSVEISKGMFRRARVMVRTKYEEAASENCATLASLGLLIVLEGCMWTLEDRLNALEDIDMESFVQFMKLFINGRNYLNLLVQGSDLSLADKVNDCVDAKLTHHMSSLETGKNILVEPTTHFIPRGSNLCVKKSGSHDDPNNSIVYFIQTGTRDNNYAYTLTVFTEFLMSMTLVPDLRGKKQIGYVVLGGLRVLSDTVGLHITTMSSNPPEYLEKKIDEYLSYLESMVLMKLNNEQFKMNYLNKFLRLVESNSLSKIEKTSGPANLMSQIEANVRSGSQNGSMAMKSHKRIRNQISYRRYNFEEEDEPINAKTIRNLTLREYMAFFHEKISVYSKSRAKMSVMVTSPMSKDEVQSKMMFLQIESFLKMKGFNIPSEDLKSIIVKSGGKPTVLLKHLFSYFRVRGESIKLLTAIVKEIVKQASNKPPGSAAKTSATPTGTSGTLQAMSQTVAPAVPLIEVTDVNSYRV
ncbi:Axl1p Ecym_4404 [Eremothecium cymbalariae DBVPG|uniref:Peptidase M16 N-terminal domain-containing protein n=1 Tax=Eremothecium cymbalariae (strain CBS 270.75 / DBVPG 7215 / KCTC 17166 / NRRL Y-17582) TaxID=931890 RepID=G8JTV5_ERECY|nr:hypothetical protein Ecym_4404 [Eremothecium cymbalariae DBVPG\